MKNEAKCEAKYGDSRCGKVAVASVISQGELFTLCKDCLKIARKQIKYNN